MRSNPTRSFLAVIPQAALIGLMATVCVAGPKPDQPKVAIPKPAPIPVYSPARKPVVTGEFPVGLITITFTETALDGTPAELMTEVGTIKGISMAEYYKLYSNQIAWPTIQPMPAEGLLYPAPQFYGYYCEYDYWSNPMGWKTGEEGAKRATELKKAALKFGAANYRGPTPRFICYNYVTTRPDQPSPALRLALLQQFEHGRSGSSKKFKLRKPRKDKDQDKATDEADADADPWAGYRPVCRWGDPLWPNSTPQINDFSSAAFAHELGHCLGAPDVYHVERRNDGIGGTASLLNYGPTANAFSRFYHHAYIDEKNYPTLKKSGTYTLHPRHIAPQGDEAIGFVIPSSHSHYLYQVEYIHHENGTVGVGAGTEGMLISVMNLGVECFLGSPDYFYVYRPYDPFFLGQGEAEACLFGAGHGRTEFNLTTEPSSRLPNLLDGGVSFKNIKENGGTLTFDVVINHQPLPPSGYAASMLPQIRLDRIVDLQTTSFSMDYTIKFRGEPLLTYYGFCWSTRKNPTVKDGNYTLTHREHFRGHALNLTPDTTYYVRAFATNGLGVRYSDEEKTVKTLAPGTPAAEIGPLCTDRFSNNSWLYGNFSNESAATDSSFVGYSPTCVLAKLIAYYRPAKFAGIGEGGKREPIRFNDLSWNPDWDDFPMRLNEIRRFFNTVYGDGRSAGMHGPTVGKDFLKNLVKVTGITSKPVLTEMTAANTGEVVALIKQDLVLSRPVMVVFVYDVEGITSPLRWAMIDGINSKQELRVDFPYHSTFGEEKPTSGLHSPASLLFKFHRVFVVTSAYYKP